MRRQGVTVDVVRAIDHDIATGVWPDMTEHGWERDDWPAHLRAGRGGRHPRAVHADLARREVVGLHQGDRAALRQQPPAQRRRASTPTTAGSAGCLVTGNEDGVKHCAMNVLYSLQHLGYVIPPQADAGWIGEAGPGPVLPRSRLGRAGERLHEPQHHVHDVEPAPPRPHAHGRRRHPGPRQPAVGVGRRLPLRLPEPRAPMSTLEWHRVADVGDLADGRVRPVTVDRHTHLPDPLRRRVRRARQPLPAPGRPARRGLDRERPPALPVARLRVRPAHGSAAARVQRRTGGAPGRGARRRRVGGAPEGHAAPADRRRRGRRDALRLGRRHRVRHGRPLQPRLRRRPAPARGGRAGSATSASATRAPPRSRRRPTASSPVGPPPASPSPGPGSTNLLTGLCDAKVDRAPVVAVSGQVPTKVLGRGAFQDLDLERRVRRRRRLLDRRCRPAPTTPSSPRWR